MLWTGTALLSERPDLTGAPRIASVLEKTSAHGDIPAESPQRGGVVRDLVVALPTPYWLFVKLYPLHGDVPYLASPEYAWPRWAGITYHASKIVPVLVLWSRLCGGEIAGWRSDARRPRESMGDHPVAAA